MQNQTNNSKNIINGELTYEDKVLQKIIGIALSDVKGLLTIDGGFFSNMTEKIVNTNDVTDGIGVEVGKKQVAVDLNIVAEYGTNISKLYDQVKDVIVNQVREMTNLEVIEVNVNVVDIKTKEQHKKDSISIQDRVNNAANKTKDAVGDGVQQAKSTLNENSKKDESRVN